MAKKIFQETEVMTALNKVAYQRDTQSTKFRAEIYNRMIISNAVSFYLKW